MICFINILGEGDIYSFCFCQICAECSQAIQAIPQITDVKRKSNWCESECDHVRSWTVGSIQLCGSRTSSQEKPEKRWVLEYHVPFGPGCELSAGKQVVSFPDKPN
jgi:hypothetical protein